MRYFILALLLSILTAHAQENSGGVAGEGPSIAKQQPAETDQSTSDAKGFPVIIIETPDQAAHAAEREKKADEHEAADLDAQVRAANAAERAAATAERQEVPAWAQIIIGIATTIIAVIALIVSLWTAAMSIRTTRAQLRAYVGLDDYMFAIDDEANIAATVFLKNTGQTPAKNVRARIEALANEPDALPIIKKDEPHSVLDLGADQRKAQEIPFLPDSTDIRLEILRGQRTGWLAGVVEYEDVFGRTYNTWFRVGLTVDIDSETHNGFMAQGGNRST